MIAKNAFWPLSSGPAGDQHRATERAQEDRRPLDLERLVGEPDEVALRAERLDPGVLGPTEVEQVLSPGVLRGDGIEDATDERVVVGRDRLARAPPWPEIARKPDELDPDRDELAFGTRHDPLGGERRRAHRVAHLCPEELRPEPALALAARQHDLAQVDLEGSHGGSGGLGGGRQAGRDGGDGGIGRRSSFGRCESVADELIHPGQLVERRLGLEAPDRAPGVTDERLASGVEDGRDPLEPAGGRDQAVGQRREFASLEREQAVAHEIDPFERVPRILAQLGLGEARRFELADEQVAVDRLVGREVRHRGELGQPPLRERRTLRAPRGRQVRPSIVVPVLADRGRKRRVEAKELGEERLEAAREVGHCR